jgi:predicted DNA-binding protein YlxM (UPF0122 family)
MPKQGRVFTDEQLRRIVNLLSTTDLAIPQIAERMQCSRSAVVAINRKFGIRQYGGRRSSWSQLEHDPRPA